MLPDAFLVAATALSVWRELMFRLRRAFAALRRTAPLPSPALGLLAAIFVILSLTIIAAAWSSSGAALGLRSTPSATPSVASSAAVAATSPAFSYAGTWTLLDLQRHIAAGDVLSISISVPTTVHYGTTVVGGTTTGLAAKLTNGQIMLVDLQITPTDAIAALRSLGYGDLLTSEALQATNSPDTGGGFNLPEILILGVLVVAAIFIIRMVRHGSTPVATRDGASGFQVIMPPAADPDTVSARLGGDHAPPPVTMADVAGIAEAKREVAEVIEFLRAPERFTRLGARIPHGLLFYGPPGTGKTMLAKAIAAEAGVPCIIASGSQFTEMYVGVGPKRVRELFGLARRFSAAIIFIDEFDSLAGRRGNEAHDNSEDRKTVNELLTQLDGFRTTDSVVCIAATNRLDVLDEAAIRPGRFSPKIHIPLPDVAARREILEVHAANKPLGADADLDHIARTTAGMSGADLADLLNEAAIFAARAGADTINAANLRAAWLKVAIGTGRQRSMPMRERAIIAAHEAGHAICGRVFASKTRVAEVSLFAHGLASGEALGFTLSVPDDNALPSESDLWADLIRLMGGRAAEQEIFSENTPGASNDFDKANQMATAMVTRWGMGHDPTDASPGHHGRGNRLSLRVRDEHNKVSEATSEAMERAILEILNTAYERALSTVRSEMPHLVAVASYLFEHERMDGDDFEALYRGSITVSDAAIAAWRAGTADPVPSIVERPRALKTLAAKVKPPHRPHFVRPSLLPRAMRSIADVAGAAAARLERQKSRDEA
jgi:cell division protease FtsH